MHRADNGDGESGETEDEVTDSHSVVSEETDELRSHESGTKVAPAPDNGDDETESEVTDSHSVVSQEIDELRSYESASTSTQSTTNRSRK